jgi:hypothetical protein
MIYYLLVAAVSAALGTPKFTDCEVKFFWTNEAETIELLGSDNKFYELRECPTDGYNTCRVQLSTLSLDPWNLVQG